jgi:hypothetical protein
VNDLLSLKQQQASVVQAYEAMKQGEETVRQGKAIMVFTVMTILFVWNPGQQHPPPGSCPSDFTYDTG